MSMDESAEWLFLLMRRNIRWDKLDAAKFELFLRRFCERGMTAMNRIEGAAKEADLHRPWQFR